MPMTKKIDLPAEGHGGARDAYTQVEGPCKALVQIRLLELTEVVHTDDRKMRLGPSPED
jgi:hypothetical protein